MAVVRGAIALGLLVAVLAASCQPQGQAFQTTLRGSSTRPLPVTLTDATQLVTGITEAPADAATTRNDPAVRTVPGDPDGLVLTWLGGACDQDAAAWFAPQDGGYVLRLAIHASVGGGCPASGVPRAVRITLARPIPAGSIVVTGG